MNVVFALIFLVGVLSILTGLSITVWRIYREQIWLRDVLVAFFANLAKRMNADK